MGKHGRMYLYTVRTLLIKTDIPSRVSSVVHRVSSAAVQILSRKFAKYTLVLTEFYSIKFNLLGT